jgi:adenine deaminase
MNFSGVIYNDKEVQLRLESERKLGKPIDSRAQGLSGKCLENMFQQGYTQIMNAAILTKQTKQEKKFIVA